MTGPEKEHDEPQGAHSPRTLITKPLSNQHARETWLDRIWTVNWLRGECGWFICGGADRRAYDTRGGHSVGIRMVALGCVTHPLCVPPSSVSAGSMLNSAAEAATAVLLLSEQRLQVWPLLLLRLLGCRGHGRCLCCRCFCCPVCAVAAVSAAAAGADGADGSALLLLLLPYPVCAADGDRVEAELRDQELCGEKRPPGD
eukprot:351398-Chlamydomonas_euryale.AAC.2